MRKMLEICKENALNLLNLSPKDKENLINKIASNLRQHKENILKANAKDLANFTRSEALKDRLKLDEKRFEALCKGVLKIASLNDPIGKVLEGWVNEAGLKIEKISIPLGLVCVIYEARPAISAELVALLLKSSNAGILKGGSEARHSNEAIFNAVKEVLAEFKLDQCYLLLSDKAQLNELLSYDDLIDVIVPRGSTAMINEIAKNTKIPLIKHDKGLCHIFADESANLKQAKEIIINAKCQRPSVCNALETLLVHKNIADELLSLLAEDFKKFKLCVHSCKKSFDKLKALNVNVLKAKEEDFFTEWLGFELSLKIVEDIDEALIHIQKHSSMHSDAILSQNYQNIELFERKVQSACVYVNASTRFSDGGEFGFGAEVGISTNKLHARGPMGVGELCTYKYIIHGQGQIRS